MESPNQQPPTDRVERRFAHKCPLGHDERDGTHAECPTGRCESCNCRFCVKACLAAADRSTKECPFGHGGNLSPKPCNLSCRCVCEKCTAADSVKVGEGIECPAGHRSTEGTHKDIPGACTCHCKFCIGVATRAGTPNHWSKPRWVLDNNGDWLFKIAEQAPGFYVVGTTVDSAEGLCECRNKERKETGDTMGTPNTRQQPAITPGHLGMPNIVAVKPDGNPCDPGLAVSDRLYAGDKCVILELTKEKLILAVDSRAGQGQKPLPPPQDAPPQRMSRHDAANLISMLHQGLIKWPDRKEGKTLTAEQVIRLAESPPPAEENFQNHERGTAFAAIMGVLAGRADAETPPAAKNWKNEFYIERDGTSMLSAATRLSRILCKDKSFSPHWNETHWVLDNKGDWLLKIADHDPNVYVVGTTVDMPADQFGVIARGIAGILAVAGIPR